MTEQQNGLEHAASAYLRSARHQPVQWKEWGEEAFRQAQQENKPVLLDIGAVWCHWCHVMDRESYEDPETAALINEHFVAIKVDRDERPDVDTRYQAAVAAISGQGGWPLTAFLTPTGKPYFGGTYFPSEDRYGRPSLQHVLRRMAAAFHERRDEVEESAASVLTAVEEGENLAGHGGELGEALLNRLLEGVLQQFDARNGGFGAQPKFPHPAVLDLLIDASTRPGPLASQCRNVVAVTLEKMAAGGIHDQLAGGFHRYSVDERWVVPHFEKMAYDNAPLLLAYTHAFQSLVEPRFAQTAAGILRWMNEWLSDREHGGFYASQDADESLDDDGDFFTWTRQEAAAALTPPEFEVAAAYYNLRAVGDMHHNPAKNVLHVVTDVANLAARLGRDPEVVRALLASAREKLYAARLQRPIPFVDRTIYTGWNGLCIAAYLAAGRALALPEATAFALKSLDRVLAAAWRPTSGLVRVVAYADAPGAPTREIPAVLDDYVFLGSALLDAWEVSGELRYYSAARQMADHLLAHFYDAEGGGFFDMPHTDSGQAPLGALSTRRKPLQDAPTPAGNSVAAALLLRLHALTGEEHFRQRATDALQAFAGVVEHLGLYAAGYGQALRRALTPPVQVCILGEDERAEELAASATARFLLNKSVVRLRWAQLRSLPPALAESLPHLPELGAGESVAVVCREFSCLPPIRDPEELLRVLGGEGS